LGLLSAAVVSNTVAAEGTSTGLLIMAHGGSPDWNRGVEEAVAPLRGKGPVEIAFGMADRASLQEAVSKLEAQGAGRIAVVRLFISGDSFKHQTEYYLGLRQDPPAKFIEHAGHGSAGQGAAGHDAHGHAKSGGDAHGHSHDGHAHGGHASRADAGATSASTQPAPAIERKAEIALSSPGLVDDADLIATILGARAVALSQKPSKEAVLMLGHGVEDDAENRMILDRLQSVADRITKERKFASVRVETLREDWREKRAEAEKRIQGYVTEQNGKGRQVIVVPVRVYGFGPYKEVLGGLPYIADEKGLLPHVAITGWIQKQYAQVCASNGWQPSASSELETTPAGKGSN
jgi:sirohydrochlorin ferrochelatase